MNSRAGRGELLERLDPGRARRPATGSPASTQRGRGCRRRHRGRGCRRSPAGLRGRRARTACGRRDPPACPRGRSDGPRQRRGSGLPPMITIDMRARRLPGVGRRGEADRLLPAHALGGHAGTAVTTAARERRRASPFNRHRVTRRVRHGTYVREEAQFMRFSKRTVYGRGHGGRGQRGTDGRRRERARGARPRWRRERARAAATARATAATARATGTATATRCCGRRSRRRQPGDPPFHGVGPGSVPWVLQSGRGPAEAQRRVPPAPARAGDPEPGRRQRPRAGEHGQRVAVLRRRHAGPPAEHARRRRPSRCRSRVRATRTSTRRSASRPRA